MEELRMYTEFSTVTTEKECRIQLKSEQIKMNSKKIFN